MAVLFNSTGFKVYNNDIINAKGCYIFDSTGKKYLDLESGVWTLSLGHCDEDVNRGIHRQLDSIIHCGYKYSNRIAEKCAEELLEITGFDGGSCTFLSSGSEAVEFAVQIAKCVRPDKKIFCLKNQYFSAYGSCMPKNTKSWEVVEWKCESEKSVEDYYNDISQSLDFSSIGVFVFEPGNSSGLVKLPPYNLVKALNILCKENDIVIVVDEVTSGIGRTGKWFGYMHYDIQPHLVAAGKGLGNGYPVSAVIIKANTTIEAKEANFHYAQSHLNDPLGCSVVFEVLTKIKRERLLDHVNEVGSYFIEKYREIQRELPIVSEVRGVGLMLCIELSTNVTSETMTDIEKELFDRGFIVGIKVKERVIRTYCPLIVTKEMIDEYITALKCVLEKVICCK